MENDKPQNKSLIGAWIKVSVLFAVLKILSSVIVDKGFFIENSSQYIIDIAFSFLLVGLIILAVFVVGKAMEKSEKGKKEK